MTDRKPKRRLRWWQAMLLVLLAPFILGIVALALALFVLWSVCLHAAVWLCWCVRGRDVLFVYSESPLWHDYIEQRVLPRLGNRAVVLNWSQRRRWRCSLARAAFYHFGGYRQYNPLAVVFRPLRRTRVFRFWQPLRDFKHGQPEALHKMESDLFALMDSQRGML